MIRRLSLALALLLAACGSNPALAVTPSLYLKGMVGKVITGGTWSKITLVNCIKCVIRDATVTPPPATNINEQAVRVIGSPGVLIEGLTITGQAATTGVKQTDPGPAGLVIGLWAGEGLHVEGSPGAIIRGCVITKFHQGLTFSKMDGLTIEHCTIANVRTTPIAGVPGNDLHIIGNGLGASYPWRWGQTPAGDHGDRIHVWTQGGDVSGLVISDNVMDEGDGAPILGVFIQPKDGRFNGVTIARNSLTASNGQGIVLKGVTGVVADNVLTWNGRGDKVRAVPRYDIYGGSVLRLERNVGKVVFDRKMTAAQRAMVTVTP